jgi:IPT/TIG domain
LLRSRLFHGQFDGLAVLLAAVALTGCQGGSAVTDAPERSLRTESRQSTGLEADLAGAHDRATEGRDLERASNPPADGDRAGSDRAERAARSERAGAQSESPVQHGESAVQYDVAQPDASDLEFSEGLPEPPQQKVVPAPAPWTPPPEADASAKPVIEDVWPAKGPASGGDRVVIRGRNLLALQVLFGLVPARIISVSESRDTLTVAAPASDAGQVAIAVTNGDGNYAVAGDAFQYFN